jgi:hypothetical protein
MRKVAVLGDHMDSEMKHFSIRDTEVNSPRGVTYRQGASTTILPID